MKLHIFPPSPNSRKAMFINAELGLNLPEEIVDLTTNAQRESAFLELNPNGRVPVLEYDDGSTLWESNAIINKLAGSVDSAMWPRSDVRYDILRWQFWESCHWTPAFVPFVAHHIFGREGIDLDAVAEGLAPFASVLDSHLEGRDWLVGGAVTTADVSVGAVLYLRDRCQFPLDDWKNLMTWLARLESLSGWNSVNGALQAA